MAIDAEQSITREIRPASAVPQLSLTRRDGELQVEEGQPPTEVASTEQEALRWQKGEDLREKWKQRQESRTKAKDAQCPARAAATEFAEQDDDAACVVESQQESSESTEEESTGTLFDDRS